MKPVIINDAYRKAAERANLPPEIHTIQAKINYLVRLGLERAAEIHPKRGKTPRVKQTA